MILVYGLVGIVWARWLEYYTKKHLEGPEGATWATSESLLHTLLWPLSLGIFCVSILIHFFKQ